MYQTFIKISYVDGTQKLPIVSEMYDLFIIITDNVNTIEIVSFSMQYLN